MGSIQSLKYIPLSERPPRRTHKKDVSYRNGGVHMTKEQIHERINKCSSKPGRN